MLFTSQEFLELEQLTSDEIEQEIERAWEVLYETQSEYARLEREMTAECALLKPSLDILFKSIKNIEAYIRKAENLLNDWDDNRYINKARKNHQIFMVKPIKTVVRLKRAII